MNRIIFNNFNKENTIQYIYFVKKKIKMKVNLKQKNIFNIFQKDPPSPVIDKKYKDEYLLYSGFER